MSIQASEFNGARGWHGFGLGCTEKLHKTAAKKPSASCGNFSALKTIWVTAEGTTFIQI